jgi:hypothetical protein
MTNTSKLGLTSQYSRGPTEMGQIKTLRKIAERMGWSPAKVLRRHKLDDFPQPGQKGKKYSQLL